jgi:hypothetical protein
MVERVVCEASAAGEDWLAGPRRIGIDEVSYRKGRRYLLCFVCHDTRIVWAAPGRARPSRTTPSSTTSARTAAPASRPRGRGRGRGDPPREHPTRSSAPTRSTSSGRPARRSRRSAAYWRLRKEDPERAVWLKAPALSCAAGPDTLSEGERARRGARANERARLPRLAATRPAQGRLPGSRRTRGDAPPRPIAPGGTGERARPRRQGRRQPHRAPRRDRQRDYARPLQRCRGDELDRTPHLPPLPRLPPPRRARLIEVLAADVVVYGGGGRTGPRRGRLPVGCGEAGQAAAAPGDPSMWSCERQQPAKEGSVS